MSNVPRLLPVFVLASMLAGSAALAEPATPPAVAPVVPPAATVAAAPVPPAVRVVPPAATAAAAPPAAAVAPPPVAAIAAAGVVQSEDNAEQYCRNIANAAADARYARQVDALAALAKEIDDRLAKLDLKRAEYEEWVKRREDFMAKADEAVVAIYSQMRPDAASQQIAAMDEESAAAILSKLNPRTASAILNEMDAGTAAHLTNVMAGLPAETKKVAKS